MEENSKKRSRKTKLVPRKYLDSDDENIAVMQQEIENEFSNVNSNSLLNKLSSNSSRSNTNLQFDVNVKIEKFDEEISDEIYSSYIDLDPKIAQNDTVLDYKIEKPDDYNTETMSTNNTEQCITKTEAIDENEEFITNPEAFNEIEEDCVTKTEAVDENEEDFIMRTEAINENNEDCITKTKAINENEEDCIIKTEAINENGEDFNMRTEAINENEEDCIMITEAINENEEGCITKTIATNSDKEDNVTETIANNKNKEDCISEIISTTSASHKEQEKLPDLSINLEKDKDDEGSQNTQIRIESVRSLSDFEKKEVMSYKFTNSMIRREFEIFSKITRSQADKLIEPHIRNYLGHYISEFKFGKKDKKMQDMLNRWASWVACYPLVRDTPSMYICSSCKLGWWHLREFIDHLTSHKVKVFDFYTEKHKSYIVTANSRHELKYSEIEIGTDCWKCGKDVTYHKDDYFECKGCYSKFETCYLLSMHEGYCEGNRKYYKKCSTSYVEFQCLVCHWKHWKEKDFFKHLLGVHSVRSDLPIFFSPIRCKKCNVMINNFDVHKCMLESVHESCEFCFKKFQSKLNLTIHNMVSKNSYECRLCKKKLDKVCMEFGHLLEHTDSYKMLYMCLVCEDTRCFLDQHSAKYHITKCHDIENENYCHIVVPRTLFKRVQPVKMMVYSLKDPTTIDKASEVELVDNAAAKDIFSDTNTTNKVETSNITRAFGSNIQIAILNKDTLQKIMNSMPSEDIPDVIKNIKTETVDDNGTTSAVNNKKDGGNNLTNNISVDVSRIKEEPMDIDESNGINLSNDVNGINGIDIIEGTRNNLNIRHEIRVDYLNSTIDVVELPINLEIKEESDDSFEDDTLLVSENASHTMKLVKKKNEKRMGTFYLKKFMAQIHNDRSNYVCTKCENSFSNFRRYLLHFVSHDYEMYTCPKCLKYCGTYLQFLGHVTYHIKFNFVRVSSIANDLSKNNNSYQCKVCQEVVGIRQFFLHWESHLSIQIANVTSQFSVDMERKPNLRDMLILLTDPEVIIPTLWREHPCIECNRKFDRKNELKRHFIEHLLKDAYAEKLKYGGLKCQICGQNFISGDQYKRHLRQHASLPVYNCEICDKAFSDSSNFSKHKKVHNLSVLICNICNKKFQKKQCLIKHLEMHKVTKPIVCKTCNKIFYSKSLFAKHMKKPRFKCQVCNIYYHKSKAKWDHMWTAHNERKVEADCPVCKKPYRRHLDVKKHMKEAHGMEYNNLYNNKTGKKDK